MTKNKRGKYDAYGAVRGSLSARPLSPELRRKALENKRKHYEDARALETWYRRGCVESRGLEREDNPYVQIWDSAGDSEARSEYGSSEPSEHEDTENPWQETWGEESPA